MKTWKKVLVLAMPLAPLPVAWLLFPLPSIEMDHTLFFQSIGLEALTCLFTFGLVSVWKKSAARLVLPSRLVWAYRLALATLFIALWLGCLYGSTYAMLFATRRLYVFFYMAYATLTISIPTTG
ncbi:hypothetical protein [Dubosiella muris]|uniref:Uncharacterized protein n=1 Tax=Dubosiella muris TaxID=3038133 RepID=A0AC61REL1_9FIRM|nr:hypothetical protein [Dubosiella muris]TGY67344.1 hypothetical protein E5336_00805 [Dubosiella muris]